MNRPISCEHLTCAFELSVKRPVDLTCLVMRGIRGGAPTNSKVPDMGKVQVNRHQEENSQPLKVKINFGILELSPQGLCHRVIRLFWYKLTLGSLCALLTLAMHDSSWWHYLLFPISHLSIFLFKLLTHFLTSKDLVLAAVCSIIKIKILRMKDFIYVLSLVECV